VRQSAVDIQGLIPRVRGKERDDFAYPHRVALLLDIPASGLRPKRNPRPGTYRVPQR
jgi:hypothetical protein